jgi:hypothetical protein
MNFPLSLSFKIIAIAPQISVTDATGNLVLYIKQKAFKLKEAVTVFGDAGQTMPLYTIGADRVLDFSATYHIADMQGRAIGDVKRQGMRSLWKAHYEVLESGAPRFTIREENGWIKVLDGLLGEVPIVGMFTGYFFNPSYIVTRADGVPVMRLTKQPAFFEGKFTLERLAPLDPMDEARTVLGLIMMLLLERSRG